MKNDLSQIDLDANQRLREGKLVEAVDGLILEAIRLCASDIHFESLADSLRVSYRLDGILVDAARLPKDVQENLFTRLKIMARIVTYQKRAPQDGRIQDFPAAGADLRLAVMPTVHGEKAVVRVLRSEQRLPALESLGMGVEAASRYRKLLDQCRGAILLTGPCNSGKTTTICASLAYLTLTRRLSIATVEDPVEYLLDKVSQTQLDGAVGLDFTQAVRAMLRHDPEVMAVGEIRNPETAQLVMEAGLLGHLVLSTIHGGTVASVVLRLDEMRIPRATVVSSLRAIVSQRLVRVVCPDCSEDQPSDVEGKKTLLTMPEDVGIVKTAVGCEECSGTGYRGRTGIFELVVVDEAVQESILSAGGVGELASELRKKAVSTLWGEGWRLVREGRTTPRELLRVIGE